MFANRFEVLFATQWIPSANLGSWHRAGKSVCNGCAVFTIDRGAKQIIVNSMWMLLTILVPANFCCLTAQFPGMLSPSEHLSVKRAISTYSSCCKGTADTCRW